MYLNNRTAVLHLCTFCLYTADKKVFQHEVGGGIFYDKSSFSLMDAKSVYLYSVSIGASGTCRVPWSERAQHLALLALLSLQLLKAMY